jgi:hypothetical protein
LFDMTGLPGSQDLQSIEIFGRSHFSSTLTLYLETEKNDPDRRVLRHVSEHPDAKGYDKRRMADAMQRLLDARVLRIETHGPPSRRYDALSDPVN